MRPSGRSRRALLNALSAAFLAALAGIVATLASWTSADAAERFMARVEHVPDGDSLTVRSQDGRRLKIRMAGIDAPEIGQPHADVSRDHLRSRIGDQPVEIDPVKNDPFGRLVARVWIGGEDLGLIQVSQGHAWHFERYEAEQTGRERTAFRQAQARARAERVGLWNERHPTPPWDYRAAERRR